MDLEDFRKLSFPVCQAHKTFNKVFGIGANKTGSTSLHAIFHATGLKVCPQAEAEITSRALTRGKLDPLRKVVDRYDAFQDVLFAIKSTYAQLDALYPDSRFILTWREPDIWFESFRNHNLRQLRLTADHGAITAGDFEGKDYLYAGHRLFKFESDWLLTVGPDYALRSDWGLSFDRDHFIGLYTRRNEEIVRHFSQRPGDLLVIDITKEHSTRKIVDFLELPSHLTIQTPWLNKGEELP